MGWLNGNHLMQTVNTTFDNAIIPKILHQFNLIPLIQPMNMLSTHPSRISCSAIYFLWLTVRVVAPPVCTFWLGLVYWSGLPEHQLTAPTASCRQPGLDWLWIYYNILRECASALCRSQVLIRTHRSQNWRWHSDVSSIRPVRFQGFKTTSWHLMLSVLGYAYTPWRRKWTWVSPLRSLAVRLRRGHQRSMGCWHYERRRVW